MTRVKSANSAARKAKDKVAKWKAKNKRDAKRRRLGEQIKKKNAGRLQNGMSWQEMSKLEMEFKMAVLHGDLAKTRRLMHAGGYTHPKTREDWNALVVASSNGRLEIARFLLECGADPNMKDSFGNTALMYAARYGHVNILSLLLNNGADIDAKGENGKTALGFALEQNQDAAILFLRGQGATE